MQGLRSNENPMLIALPEYKFVAIDEVYKQTTEPQWLIEDYIPKLSIGMLYGPSGIGKTHIVLDIAARVANGIPWCEKETEKGRVLVMAGEGQSGLKRRLQSIEKQHEFTIDRNNLFFSERAVGIDTDKGFTELTTAIEELDEHPELIIVDTLSRHLMNSSENSNEDMATFINRLEQIKQLYNTTVLLIHHTGKSEGNGARGASSIRANIDFSFVLTRRNFAGQSFCRLKCEKQKDASDQVPELNFKVAPVSLGEKDSKGREILGACARRAQLITGDDEKFDEDIALDAFANTKSQWQENFLKIYEEQVQHNLKLETIKKKFRTEVQQLVDSGRVQALENNKFELVET